MGPNWSKFVQIGPNWSKLIQTGDQPAPKKIFYKPYPLKKKKKIKNIAPQERNRTKLIIKKLTPIPQKNLDFLMKHLLLSKISGSSAEVSIKQS